MKKFMFYFMVLNTFIAFVTMIAALLTGSSLPALVFVLRGILIFGAMALTVKKYVSWIRRREIAAYYIADAAVAIINLLFLSVFSPTDVSFFELSLTGTLITPVLNAVLLFFLLHSSAQYVAFENIGEPVAVPSGRQAVSTAVKQA